MGQVEWMSEGDGLTGLAAFTLRASAFTFKLLLEDRSVRGFLRGRPGPRLATAGSPLQSDPSQAVMLCSRLLSELSTVMPCFLTYMQVA